MTANRLFITISAAAVVLTAACDEGEKTPAHNTDHPEHGKIVLTTDWSQRGEGIDIPGSYHVRANGDEAGKQTFTAHTNEHPELFEPGTHRLHVYHDAEGITVAGNTASAAAAVSSRAEGTITGNPGWFFSCAMDVDIEADRVHEFTAAMQQRVRELTLVVEPTGGTDGRIAGITGILSGVAGTLDIDTGELGSPSDVAIDFSKITAGDDEGKWSATVRLLGVIGDEQTLTGMVSFTDGVPDDMPLESPLGDALAGFNDGSNSSLTLGGTVVETPTKAGFTATITGWNEMDKGRVTAN